MHPAHGSGVSERQVSIVGALRESVMPALRAFGTKWRIGSDDFVFPYVGTILIRFIW